MAIKINQQLQARDLLPLVDRLMELSATKIAAIERTWEPSNGTPVFTVEGRYATRGWTEWTQGFRYGSAVLQYEITGEKRFLELGREETVRRMSAHVTHVGVHDHGFNNVSTYGNLLRLMREGTLAENASERDFYELALKASGAVQAARWTDTADGGGFVYSFNGPHSLFVDTVRSLRSLALAHGLGQRLWAEGDREISLLDRLAQHARETARYSVYYGEGRDVWDVRGRTAHESVFNVRDGNFRCPNSQQGYSPYSTWTRGLAWAICGFAEQLEFLDSLSTEERASCDGNELGATMRRAAEATADFYLKNSCADGIPIWDTGAPGTARMGDYLARDSEPFNEWEPMDSSAAAIAAQGLLRLGNWLERNDGRNESFTRYRQAGLTVARSLFSEPYLSTDPEHQGLILHSVYHRPNGWDYIPAGRRVPCGESSMWGDYHARELALMIWREARGRSPYRFFDSLGS